MEKEIIEKVKSNFLKHKKFDCVGKFVERNYTFELPIQHGISKYYKLKYDFLFGALPIDFSGEHFTTVIGTSYTALELFLLKKELKGPQWITISKFSPTKNEYSHTKFELQVGNLNCIKTIKQENQPPAPTLKVMSLSVKSIRP